MATAYSGNDSGQYTGSNDLSNFTINQTISIASGAIGERIPIAVINGNTTITIPTGATCCWLTPPAGSTVNKTLKGAAGDTGVPMAPAIPARIPIKSGSASFIITGDNTETCEAVFM